MCKIVFLRQNEFSKAESSLCDVFGCNGNCLDFDFKNMRQSMQERLAGECTYKRTTAGLSQEHVTLGD